MRFATHSIGLAVLLALTLGHASIAVHAAAHGSGEAMDCDLCIAYGDASETLDAHHEHGVSPVVDTHVIPTIMAVHASRPAMSAQPRGPPSIH